MRSLIGKNGEGVGAGWGRRGAAAVSFAARVTLDRLAKHFGDVAAVADVSLDVAPGEIVCLLGPSGCGKTTLLRMVAGVEHPSGGRILIDGQEVAADGVFLSPERRGVGLMFQDFALFPHLTLLHNVAFGLRALGRNEARRAALAALERVGLAHYAGEYPHILSGGEQQRVALARALAPRPGVMLMDEPFSGLDPRLREIMREETHTLLQETRATCILVTHAPEEAMRMGDRIALMRKGRVTQVGTPEELYRAPSDISVARTFSLLNEIPTRVIQGAVESPFGRFGAPDIADGEAVLCIRQQGVRLVPSGQGRAGRVLDKRFLGDAALLEIGVEGLDLPLMARLVEADAPGLGAEVGVTVDAAAVLVFSASPAPVSGAAG